MANNASTNAQIPPLVEPRIGGDGHLGPSNGRFLPTETDPVHTEPFVVRSGPFSGNMLPLTRVRRQVVGRFGTFTQTTPTGAVTQLVAAGPGCGARDQRLSAPAGEVKQTFALCAHKRPEPE